ncbi:hypothetical protein [Aeromicrobium sp. Root472D3]|uniref:hypothetical protein n=1 Tax=Aeromicrobium sp. Root472D3 TaxID=1736540 RepID=UPI0007001E2E|nr:hypothetical protein [Aeromicrobium sp. Root472D3]KQX75844.1 hypothetical protein ASD10_12060 [Aeromicrobium sp. Root472D3]
MREEQACPVVVRRVLVAAASCSGGTAGDIADRVADHLHVLLPGTERVERVGLADLRVLDGADAVVLGSTVLDGHWMRPAAKALEYVRQDPPARLWLFSTGPVSEVECENEQVVSADAMARRGEACGHMVFGGALGQPRRSVAGRLVATVARAVSGDRRDWRVVDAWTEHIARELVVSDLRRGVRRSSRSRP